MSVQTTEFSSWATKALAYYNLDTYEVRFIQHHDNITFQVVTHVSKEMYLLRIHKPLTENFVDMRQQSSAINSEMLWLEALHRDTTLAVQQPIKNNMNAFVTLISTMQEGIIPCSLLRWIEGDMVSPDVPLTSKLAAALGEVVAHLHNHVAHWEIPNGFLRPTYDIKYFQQRMLLLSSGVSQGIITSQALSIIQKTVRLCIESVASTYTDNNSWGLVHTDLHRGNCLIYHEEIRPIDFALCGFSYFVYDLGSTLAGLSKELRQACINGYLTHRQLPENAIRLLEASFLLSRIGAYIFMLSNHAEHEWLRERIPRFIAQECQLFLSNQSLLFSV